ncbi:family 2 glycosyl transferase [Lacticaseibacillus paracasei subsp. paracasei Lpp221]|uniref:glycosyltransferase n=1 Tax=Lacticaseibacillus paracasei TaxID=1597 RepID=UPI000343B724|nr:glycosyltransferase [Lacticaseibacillus paracasei]EPC80430.1 family 2 glycosyl transferase [Lacticaseibacillus paracasei subsp. paracasei Lpp221]
MNEHSVSVVIVTYGSRIKFVNKVATQVLSMSPVRHLVLVNNGNKERFQSDDSRLISINLTENTGSANGFFEGLKKAREIHDDFVWLLDDDNLPQRDALDVLLKDYDHSEGNQIYSSLRLDRTELINNGEMHYEKNSFFGFSLSNKLMRHDATGANFTHEKTNFLICDTVPYGGLMLPLEVLIIIGLPNRDYYLYNDDNEFTYRLTKNGHLINCDPESKIQDLESSWYRREKVPMFQGFFRTKMIASGLYTIRNRTYFEKNNIATNKAEYIFNIAVYMAYVFLFYMPKNGDGLKKYHQMISMIKLGYRGKLGRMTLTEGK